MKFATRESAEDFIISGKAPRIGSSQVFEIVRCAGETDYRLAVYNVRSVNPFRVEFSHYLRESNK